MGDEKVTSQAKKDVLVPLEAEWEAAPAEAAPTAGEAEAAPMATAKAAPAISVPQEEQQTSALPAEDEYVQSTMADLAQRVAKIEAAMGKLEELQKTVRDANTILRKQPRDFQSVVTELQAVSEQVEEISEKLRSTPVYDMGEIFQCNVCHSDGLCAIRVKCTQCGRENWWGWWPPKE
jgi:DNA repair exonuclease SbcCD ATPase subunit